MRISPRSGFLFFAFKSIIERGYFQVTPIRMASSSSSSVSSTEGLSLSILALGDSLTEGHCRGGCHFAPYTDRLRSLIEAKLDFQGLSKVKTYIVNEGISGELTREMIPRLQRALTAANQVNQQFDIIVLLGGTNDLGYGLADEAAENLGLMFEASVKSGARTFLMTVPESAYLDVERLRNLINLRIKNIAGENTIDLHKEFPYRSLTREEKKERWDDGLHFTPKGYEIMGDIVFFKLEPVIEQILAEKSQLRK